MRRLIKYIALFSMVLMALLFVRSAHASIGGIGGSDVNAGVFSAGLLGLYSDDSDQVGSEQRTRYRVMTNYGVTDNFATGLLLQGQNRSGDNFEIEQIMWENSVEFTNAKHDGFYSGMRLRYSWRDGDKKPDDVHMRLILGMPVERWDFRYNQIIGHEVGVDSRAGILWDSRFQATYAYTDNHVAGIESINNLGNLRSAESFDEQSHEVGIVFRGNISETVSYETNYRNGISSYADRHTLRFFLIRSF